MKKFSEVMNTDVHVSTSHLWVIGLGVVVALGFFIDCVIAPIFSEWCKVIDYEELLESAGIIIGLEATRKYVLTRYKYLNDLTISGTKKNTPEEILKEKLWVPAVGWCLVCGYAVNILLVPFIDSIKSVDWFFLHAGVSIFLVVSGLREYGVYSKTEKQMIEDGEFSDTPAPSEA